MTSWVEASLRELRFALRTCRRQPGFALATIVTLALGAGVNTAVFAVTYGVLLRPLPYDAPSNLVILSTALGGEFDIHLGELQEWQSRLRSIDRASAYHGAVFRARYGEVTETLRTGLVSDDFFDVLRPTPTAGSLAGLERTTTWAVIGSTLASRIGQSSGESAIGRAIVIGGRTYTVVGVISVTARWPAGRTELWIPARSVDPVNVFEVNEDARPYHVLARLAPRATLAQAREDVVRVYREVRGQNRATRENAPSIMPLADAVAGRVRPAIVAAQAAAALVLLVACANAAMLLLGRAVARERELATARSLGASLSRLAGSSIAETVVLGVGGSVLGIALAALGVRLFAGAAGSLVPRILEITLDLPVLVVTTSIMALVSVGCGLAPLLHAARVDTATVLRRTSVIGSVLSVRLRAALVVVQIAAAIVLLVGASLLGQTAVRLLRDDAGIEPARALTAQLMMSDTMGFEAASREPLLAQLVERVMGVPGVSHAGVASALPPDNSPIELEFRFVRRGREESSRMRLVSATPGFFGALGIRLHAGRLFEQTDLGSDTPVAIVSESAARFLAPAGDLLGRPLPVTLPVIRGQRIRPLVVGIVNDVKYGGLQGERGPAVYIPWRQLPASLSYFVARAENPRAARPVIQRIIRETDPTLPDVAVRTLEEVFERSIADRRLRAFPAVAFALLALALSLVGLSATLFRAVAERRRELAVRLAVGATPRNVTSRVLRDAASLIAIGVVVGTLVTAVTSRGLSQFLYGISAHDPWTFAAAVVVVTAASLVASLVPARQAARIDPLTALRAE